MKKALHSVLEKINAFFPVFIFLSSLLFYVFWILKKDLPIFDDEFYFYSQLIYLLRDHLLLPYTYNLTQMAAATVLAFPSWLMTGETSIFFLRLTSALASAGTAALIFLLLRRYVHAAAAYLGVLIFFFSRLTLYFATTGFSEATFNFFLILTLYYFLEIYFENSDRAFLKFSIAFGLLLLSRFLGVFLLPGFLLVYFLKYRFTLSRKKFWYFFGISSAAILVALLTFLMFYFENKVLVFGGPYTFTFSAFVQRCVDHFVARFADLVTLADLGFLILLVFFFPFLRMDPRTKKTLFALYIVGFLFYLLSIWIMGEPTWNRRYFPMLIFLILISCAYIQGLLAHPSIVPKGMAAFFVAATVLINLESFPFIPTLPTVCYPSPVGVILAAGNRSVSDSVLIPKKNWRLYRNGDEEPLAVKDLPLFQIAEHFNTACTTVTLPDDSYRYLFLNHVSTTWEFPPRVTMNNIPLDAEKACKGDILENSRCRVDFKQFLPRKKNAERKLEMCIKIGQDSNSLPGIVEVVIAKENYYRKYCRKNLQEAYFIYKLFDYSNYSEHKFDDIIFGALCQIQDPDRDKAKLRS